MAMFESGLNLNAHPDLALVAQKARAVLERAAEKLSAAHGRRASARRAMISAHIWAMSHGVVELYMRGDRGPAPYPAEDLLETGIGIYLRGLGLLPADA